MIDYAQRVANDLLTIGAVKFSPQEPFTWASGIKSPIYTDNRMTIGFLEVRRNIAQGLAQLIRELYPDVEIIGGVATAGIPHAAWVAEVMQLPMIYVRSKPKDHGAGRQIEGANVNNRHVVLIDDLISTGGSVLGAVKAVQDAGGIVSGVTSIFSYELPAGEKNFAAAETQYASLTNYTQLMESAIVRGELDKNQIATLQDWKRDPETWDKK